jgi:hypothetical protein
VLVQCCLNIVSYTMLLAMRTSKRIVVKEKDRVHLGQVIRNGNTPQGVSLSARIVLLSADGVSTGDIMRRLSTSTPTISRWRNRYEADGVVGLFKDRSRPGRKRLIGQAKVREVVHRTLQEKPSCATHWGTRSPGEGGRSEISQRPAHLESSWTEAPPSSHLQAESRPTFCGEA